MKRGIIGTDTLRKPGAPLTSETKADVDWLMTRIERRRSGSIAA
jgi:4-hydroxy-tetrahydrodipicolinate synthase